jgi:septal ring factor EnvC (AmiA/AmiB activator)
MNALRPLLLGLLLALPFTASAAEEKTASAKDLTELRKQAEKLSAEINADRKNQAKIQTELRNQDLAIAKLNKELKELDDKLAAEEKQLKEQEEKAQEIDVEVKKRQANLAKNIRALHASGQLPDLKLMFNQEDLGEWQRLITYYGYFNKALQTEIEELHAQLSEQEQLRDEIGSTKNALAEKREEFTEEQDELKEQKAARHKLLASLNKEINNKDAELKELNASEQELQRVLAAIGQPQFAQNFPPVNAGNFAAYQGKLPWPTIGKIQHSFGSARSRSQRRYNGIVLSAPAGEPVLAIFSGRVVYSDWLRGYGLLIIVDHGKGYTTLYAHNDTLFKKIGDSVQAGEQIATVGTTGGLSKPGLYFEIRHNGKPVNPQKWLTPNATIKASR